MGLTKNQKRSLLFWILYNEYNRTQSEIATFLKVQQSTVSMGLKEANYLISLNEAQKEINALRSQLRESPELGEPKTGIGLFLP